MIHLCLQQIHLVEMDQILMNFYRKKSVIQTLVTRYKKHKSVDIYFLLDLKIKFFFSALLFVYLCRFSFILIKIHTLIEIKCFLFFLLKIKNHVGYDQMGSSR